MAKVDLPPLISRLKSAAVQKANQRIANNAATKDRTGVAGYGKLTVAYYYDSRKFAFWLDTEKLNQIDLVNKFESTVAPWKSRIWKTELKGQDVQDIEIPVGAEILTASHQGERICIWYRCDPEAPLEPRKVMLVGTGHPTVKDGTYIGTAHLRGGLIVVHVFIWPVVRQ